MSETLKLSVSLRIYFSSILTNWKENRKVFFFSETIFKVQKLMAHKWESSTSASCCGVCTGSWHLKHKLFLIIIKMKVDHEGKKEYVEKKVWYITETKFSTLLWAVKEQKEVFFLSLSLFIGFLLNLCGSKCLSQTYTSCYPCISLFHLPITSLALCINPSKKALGSWWPVLF